MPRHRGAAAAVTYMVEEADLTTTFYEIFVDPYARPRLKGNEFTCGAKASSNSRSSGCS